LVNGWLPAAQELEADLGPLYGPAPVENADFQRLRQRIARHCFLAVTADVEEAGQLRHGREEAAAASISSRTRARLWLDFSRGRGSSSCMARRGRSFIFTPTPGAGFRTHLLVGR